MKIKPEHFEHIKTEINALLAKQPERIVSYELGRFPRADRVKDLQIRFNWDLLLAAGLNPWVCKELYTYANDHHINTALKAICPTVERKY